MLPYIKLGILTIPSYGLFMSLGIILSFHLGNRRIKKYGIDFDSLLIVGAISLIFAIFGSVFTYYTFSYGLIKLFNELLNGDFSALKNIGFVYYGGLFGGIFGAKIAVKLNKSDFLPYSDAIVPVIPLGHAIGRIGCLFADCCYGKPYDGLFCVNSAYVDKSITLFPIQIIESIINIALLFILLFYVKVTLRRRHNTLLIYLLLYSVERFILEFFRGDSIRGIFLTLSASQWISIIIFVVIITYSIFQYYKRKCESSISSQ